MATNSKSQSAKSTVVDSGLSSPPKTTTTTDEASAKSSPYSVNQVAPLLVKSPFKNRKSWVRSGAETSVEHSTAKKVSGPIAANGGLAASGKEAMTPVGSTKSSDSTKDALSKESSRKITREISVKSRQQELEQDGSGSDVRSKPRKKSTKRKKRISDSHIPSEEDSGPQRGRLGSSSEHFGQAGVRETSTDRKDIPTTEELDSGSPSKRTSRQQKNGHGMSANDGSTFPPKQNTEISEESGVSRGGASSDGEGQGHGRSRKMADRVTATDLRGNDIQDIASGEKDGGVRETLKETETKDFEDRRREESLESAEDKDFRTDVVSKAASSPASSKENRSQKLEPRTPVMAKKREATGKLGTRSSTSIGGGDDGGGGGGGAKPVQQRSPSSGVGRKGDAGQQVSSPPQKPLPVLSGPSRLLTLARRGEWSVLDQVIRAMEKGNEEINYADEESHVTTLMLAVKENRPLIVERLLEIGADINSRAKDGKTPMHFASLYAKDDMVKLLLNKKADPNIIGGPRRQLPLHMACSRVGPGMMLVVQAVLRASGRDCRVTPDKDGMLPLHVAVEVGNSNACSELLTVQPEEQLKHKRKLNGDSAMHMISRRHDHDLMKLLGDHHADVNQQNNDGNTPLHLSVLEGDAAAVQLLHKYKANANITNKMDRTPLHIATELGHTAIVEILIDKFRAGISGRTKDGSTLIHIAASCGHPETALAFLKKGVPLHMPNKSGASCLHAAAMTGHVQVIKTLLNKGAQVDGKSKDNYSALHVAVQFCKPLAVQTLLGYGAQVDTKGGKVKETPLHIAASVPGGEKCVEMLIKSGANVNITQENLETPLHIAARHGNLQVLKALLEDGSDPTLLSTSGESALHAAVRHCHFRVVEELLSSFSVKRSRFDAVMLVNQQNREGETAIHYAAELTHNQIHFENEDSLLMKFLLDFDGDVNIRTQLTQETAIHYAARAGNKEVMQEIVDFLGPLKAPRALNIQAKNGASALQMASEHGHLDVVNILLKNNARVDVFDEQGKAALHLSAENGHEAVTETLLKNRAYVGVKSKLGVTPLHLAAQSGHTRLARLLIEHHGAGKNAVTLAKQTPMHLAARNGQKMVVATLLKLNADATATDTQGQTPLHLAAENDHSDVVKMFLKYRPELVSMANTDLNGMTCAHIAAYKGSTGVVQELMRFNRSVVLTAKNKTNESTTLHLAAMEGHADLVRVLVEAGAQVDEENADGMTALHLAAKYGHLAVLEVLRHKVILSATSTKTGFTAMHVAAQYGQTEFVHEMLNQVPATLVTVPPLNTQQGTAAATAAASGIAIENGFTALHLAAQSGHEGLARVLLNVPGIHLDAKTVVNESIALHLAAQNGHTEVVSLLLNKSSVTIGAKDAGGRTSLHLAAYNGHIDIVSLLLGQGADIDAYDKGGCTALHLASRSGRLNVVRLLIESGANPRHETMTFKVPVSLAAEGNHTEVLSYLFHKDHGTHQLIDDNKFIFDLMVVGKMTANKLVREFILTSPTPAEIAAKLSKIFRSLALQEKERSKDLNAVGDFCETMAVELSAIAAGICHAGPLLNSIDGSGVTFLDILIDCEQKEVVAHPTVQLYLSEIWTGHLSTWQSWKLLLLFFLLLFLPPLWIVISLPLKHRFFRVPVVKFMSHLVSHIYLIALFIVCIVFPPVTIWNSANLIPHWYEWLLLAWLSGLLVSQLTNSEDRAGLGWLKVIVIGIAGFGILVHLIAFAFQGNQRLECIYIRNQFLAFALLLSFIQLMEFLSFHNLFGPWAIIIRELMKDLLRFLVVLFIFMLGFTFHLAAIYVPVTDHPALNPDLGDGNGDGSQTQRTSQGTFELLFFAIFGLIDPENMPPLNSHPWWSLYLLKSVVGVYMLITFIVLVNLLIAMMTDTYADIQAASDTEWKFGRAKLFRNMKKTSSTPSPMNLFTKFITYIKILIKYKGGGCKLNIQHLVDAEEGVGLDVESQTHVKANRILSAHARSSTNGKTTSVKETAVLYSPSPGAFVRIEKVVDWSEVTEKYLAIEGLNNEIGEYSELKR